MLSGAFQRLRRAVLTAPRASDWFACFGAAALLALSSPLAFASGLLHWAPRNLEQIALIGASALFVPALAEEAVFRGALTPSREETSRPVLAMAFSTVLFVLWHVLETLWLPGARAVFLRADFLVFAGSVGAACAILRWRSGSLWTAVVLHWSVVLVWQGWLGGLSLSELR